jgi:hypothetical protein
LKQVIVVAVDQGDLNRSAAKRFDRLKTAEAPTHDHYPVERLTRRSLVEPVLSGAAVVSGHLESRDKPLYS